MFACEPIELQNHCSCSCCCCCCSCSCCYFRLRLKSIESPTEISNASRIEHLNTRATRMALKRLEAEQNEQNEPRAIALSLSKNAAEHWIPCYAIFQFKKATGELAHFEPPKAVCISELYIILVRSFGCTTNRALTIKSSL